jgi:hypothetical protein
MAHAIASLVALAALAALAAAQIKSEPPRVFLDQLKLPPGFSVELYHPGLTLDGLRDVVPSGASQQGGPIIVRRLARPWQLAAIKRPLTTTPPPHAATPRRLARRSTALLPPGGRHLDLGGSASRRRALPAASQPFGICTAGTGAR